MELSKEFVENLIPDNFKPDKPIEYRLKKYIKDLRKTQQQYYLDRMSKQAQELGLYE